MIPRGVFLTFDVECSMGGAWGNPALRPVPPARAVWGEYGQKRLGLPLIVELLERNGLTATFFVEAFTDEQGFPGEMERACHFLLEHGQDVQLHIHPGHELYGRVCRGFAPPRPGSDQLADLPPAEQLALLQEGAERLRRWTGQPPVAFRAGNMAASKETLRQVEVAGILIDSSYAFPYAGGQCHFPADEPYNGSKWYGGVLELALSGFRKLRLPGLHRAKPLDLVGIGFEECRDAIGRICGAGADAVVILHSFSLFKVRNVQYEGGRPNRIVTRRFHRLCHWLSSSPELPTYTFSQLARAVETGQYEAAHVTPCRLSHPRTLVRKAVQAWNGFYWT